MTPRMPSLDQYSVTAHREGVRAAAAWLAGCGRQRDMPPSEVSRLDQCLDEALANVIRHAYHGRCVAIVRASAPYPLLPALLIRPFS